MPAGRTTAAYDPTLYDEYGNPLPPVDQAATQVAAEDVAAAPVAPPPAGPDMAADPQAYQAQPTAIAPATPEAAAKNPDASYAYATGQPTYDTGQAPAEIAPPAAAPVAPPPAAAPTTLIDPTATYTPEQPSPGPQPAPVTYNGYDPLSSAYVAPPPLAENASMSYGSDPAYAGGGGVNNTAIQILTPSTGVLDHRYVGDPATAPVLPPAARQDRYGLGGYGQTGYGAGAGGMVPRPGGNADDQAAWEAITAPRYSQVHGQTIPQKPRKNTGGRGTLRIPTWGSDITIPVGMTQPIGTTPSDTSTSAMGMNRGVNDLTESDIYSGGRAGANLHGYDDIELQRAINANPNLRDETGTDIIARLLGFNPDIQNPDIYNQFTAKTADYLHHGRIPGGGFDTIGDTVVRGGINLVAPALPGGTIAANVLGSALQATPAELRSALGPWGNYLREAQSEFDPIQTSGAADTFQHAPIPGVENFPVVNAGPVHLGPWARGFGDWADQQYRDQAWAIQRGTATKGATSDLEVAQAAAGAANQMADETGAKDRARLVAEHALQQAQAAGLLPAAQAPVSAPAPTSLPLPAQPIVGNFTTTAGLPPAPGPVVQAQPGVSNRVSSTRRMGDLAAPLPVILPGGDVVVPPPDAGRNGAPPTLPLPPQPGTVIQAQPGVANTERGLRMQGGDQGQSLPAPASLPVPLPPLINYRDTTARYSPESAAITPLDPFSGLGTVGATALQALQALAANASVPTPSAPNVSLPDLQGAKDWGVPANVSLPDLQGNLPWGVPAVTLPDVAIPGLGGQAAFPTARPGITAPDIQWPPNITLPSRAGGTATAPPPSPGATQSGLLEDETTRSVGTGIYIVSKDDPTDVKGVMDVDGVTPIYFPAGATDTEKKAIADEVKARRDARSTSGASPSPSTSVTAPASPPVSPSPASSASAPVSEPVVIAPLATGDSTRTTPPTTTDNGEGTPLLTSDGNDTGLVLNSDGSVSQRSSGSSGGYAKRYRSGDGYSRSGYSSKKKTSSGGRWDERFWPGFPFGDRPNSPIRQLVLDAIAASRARGQARKNEKR